MDAPGWAAGSSPSFKVDDFAAYRGQQTRRLLGAAIGADPTAIGADPAAEVTGAGRALCHLPVARRAVNAGEPMTTCRWWPGDRAATGAEGRRISTRRGFAGLAELPRLDREPGRPGAPSAAGPPAEWPAEDGSSGTALIPERGVAARSANRRLPHYPGKPTGICSSTSRASATTGGRPGVQNTAVPVRRGRHGRVDEAGLPPVHADLG